MKKQKHKCHIDDFIFSILHQARGASINITDDMNNQYSLYYTEKEKYKNKPEKDHGKHTLSDDDECLVDQVSTTTTTTISKASIKKSHTPPRNVESSLYNFRIEDDDDDNKLNNKETNHNKKKKIHDIICLDDFMTKDELDKLHRQPQNKHTNEIHNNKPDQDDFPEVLGSSAIEDLTMKQERTRYDLKIYETPDIDNEEQFPSKV